jgi:hypothetical protein
VRPQVAELARVATFLASEGIALNATAYALFVDAVQDNLYLAISLLERRANGDYSKDETLDSFPVFADGARTSTGPSCWELSLRGCHTPRRANCVSVARCISSNAAGLF